MEKELRKKRGRKKAKRTIILAATVAFAMFISGCVSHSEMVYKKGKLQAKTYTFDGNVSTLQDLNKNPEGISKTKDGAYVVKHEDSFNTGKLERLRITQKMFTYEDLEFDGGHYTVQKDMDILSQEAEKLGKVKKGDTIQAVYFVGELAVVLVDDTYGFINAGNLTDENGKAPETDSIAAGPQWKTAKDGSQIVEVANQQTFTLKGEKIQTIIIDATVTAESYINMDFDTLIIENDGNVYIQDCKGKTILNRGGAKVEIGEDAKVEKQE